MPEDLQSFSSVLQFWKRRASSFRIFNLRQWQVLRLAPHAIKKTNALAPNPYLFTTGGRSRTSYNTADLGRNWVPLLEWQYKVQFSTGIIEHVQHTDSDRHGMLKDFLTQQNDENDKDRDVPSLDKRYRLIAQTDRKV